MKTQKSIQTKQALLEAAEILFMQKSVDKVTVAQITRLAGVAKGTFYLYFDSKDALVWDFAARKVDALLKPVLSLDSCGFTLEAVHAVVDHLIAYVKENEPLMLMLHQVRFYGYLGKENLQSKHIGILTEPVSHWIQRGKQAGLIHADDPEFMACFLVLSVHNMFDSVIMKEIPFTFDVLGEHLKALLIKLFFER